MKTYLHTLGDYQVVEKLGRGGMADVYLALDTRNQQKIALKLVEHGQGAEAEEILAAERLGAQLQSHLCAIDARIPRIHSYGNLEDYFYIDMEYVEGRDLSECIRMAALEVHEAARIAAELCSILNVAHKTTVEINGKELRAIVHGDIKPRNIRLDTEGRVWVLDFGIAKGLSLTRKLTSNFFGSASYSSPERLDTGQIDEMSDLWAVGVVLYEMIRGQAPFEAPSTESLERIVRSRTPPQPLPDTCPHELQQIVYKALAQTPGKRYLNAMEFESDLRAFLSGKPTVAARENEETRRSEPGEPIVRLALAPHAGPPADQTRRTRATPKWLQRSKKILGIGLPALFSILMLWEAAVYHNATKLEPGYVTQQIDGDKAWEQYQQIKRASPMGLAPLALRGPLGRLLLDSCQKVADEYRNSETPRIREGDWQRCKRFMLYARQLHASDKRAAAMLSYADAHIMRINRKDVEAVSAFQRAASMDSEWPDPQLGMARVYIYGLKDFEAGIQALKRAEDLGHRLGKRELAQRADALRSRGLQCWQGSVQLRDQPQETELLSRAKDDLEKALEIYTQIAPWGDSATQAKSAQAAIEKIENRIDEIDPPGSIFTLKWWKRRL